MTRRGRYHFQRDPADVEEPAVPVPAPGANYASGYASGPEIAFPTVVQVDGMPEPGVRLPVPWFTPWPMSGWPLVYDYDAPSFTPWQRRVQ